jgi:hypothetical protein
MKRKSKEVALGKDRTPVQGPKPTRSSKPRDPETAVARIGELRKGLSLRDTTIRSPIEEGRL